ncbi:hypothetical protein K1719_023554 [Acacia pycnantha]|nr:hypothetical protein K1719_023554 [Acacia pycnantha]
MFPLLRFLHFFSLSFLFSVSAHGSHDNDRESGDTSLNLRASTLILAKIWDPVCWGVSLGTAMMHFISEAHQTFHDLTDKEYPFAFMLACVGYLFTMLADSVFTSVFAWQNKRSGSGADCEHQGYEMAKENANVVTSQSQ